MRRRHADRFDRAADERLHAHRPVADRDRLQLIRIEAFGLQHLFGDQLIRAFDRRHADSFALELLHIFDLGPHHHVVRPFFEMDKNQLHREIPAACRETCW